MLRRSPDAPGLATWQAVISLCLALAACGGAEPPASDASAVSVAPASAEGGRRMATAARSVASREEAFRLLNQATFGPTAADLDRVQAMGVNAWIDEQLAMPAQDVHRARWLVTDSQVKRGDPKNGAGNNDLISSIYQQGLEAPDQLRQRVKLALSEIFVISMGVVGGPRAEAAAAFYDMLGRDAFGSFRTLLEDVAKHPATGIYLSHIKNQPGDPSTGRQPDQNFAREVMQLYTIGLYQLNNDGTPQLKGGAMQPTYDTPDIEGLSNVFTGWSWAGPDTTKLRFFGVDPAYIDPERNALPMQGYGAFHATTAKTFLGTTIPAQPTPNPEASIKVALDTLFNHRNVGPFIGRQLIQRLVMSDPSPAYVARVANVFADNGKGKRGDMKAVVRAVLTDTDARDAGVAARERYGKVREPMLRVTAWLRAFNAKSDSGQVLMAPTSDSATELNQTPLSAPSVFNFFRPGFVPVGGEAEPLEMTLPEMQITDETSVAGYVNYMTGVVQRGIGPRGIDNLGKRPDVQPDYSAELALAEQPDDLVDSVFGKLLPQAPQQSLRSEVVAAVTAQVMPPRRSDNSNEQARQNAKLRRVQTAILLTLGSPEFLIQK